MAKKILIVEDEEFISTMYKMKFDMSGYETRVAGDGAKGIEMALNEKPDLILLDIMMPKMDGYEVLARLKSDDRTRNIKVYILSNFGQSSEIDLGIAGGAEGFLIKASLTPSQLVDCVNKIFEGKPVGEKRPAQKTETKAEPIKSTKPLAKVLLVENSEVLSGMYRVALEKSGFEVELTQNGAWGLKLANQKKFDIIIMDIVMPEMSEQDAIKELKPKDNMNKIPIIALSNDGADDDDAESKKYGITSYLMKSQITPARLVTEVKNILKII